MNRKRLSPTIAKLMRSQKVLKALAQSMREPIRKSLKCRTSQVPKN